VDGDAGDLRRAHLHPRTQGRLRHQTEVMRPTAWAQSVILLTLLGLGGAAQSPADWPQWRGPNRDGALIRFTKPKSLPEQLTRKWRVEVGLGYATPILVGGRVYMYSRRGDNEVLTALNADTGRVIWQTSYAATFTMNPAAAAHEKGPKSTPTFANGRLYTLGM